MQLTITLPDDLANQFNKTLPPDQQSDFFVQKVTEFLNTNQPVEATQITKTFNNYFVEGDPIVAEVDLDIGSRISDPRPEVDLIQQDDDLDFIGMWRDKSFSDDMMNDDMMNSDTAENEVTAYVRQLRRGRNFAKF